MRFLAVRGAPSFSLQHTSFCPDLEIALSGFYRGNSVFWGGSEGIIEGSMTLKQPYRGSGDVFPEKILIFPLPGIDSGAFWLPKLNFSLTVWGGGEKSFPLPSYR